MLIGVVFSVLVADDELQRADEMDEHYRPAFKFYQSFQMALGIFKGLLIAPRSSLNHEVDDGSLGVWAIDDMLVY